MLLNLCCESVNQCTQTYEQECIIIYVIDIYCYETDSAFFWNKIFINEGKQLKKLDEKSLEKELMSRRLFF